MKTINVLLLSLFMFGAAMAQNMTERPGESPHIADMSNSNGSKAAWDVEFTFESKGYCPGIATDGNKIYTSVWYATKFYEYDMDGGNEVEFLIPGATTIIEYTYDGTYFYGAKKSSLTILKLDLENRALISSITVNCTGVTELKHITYDPTLDSGNGGFWVGELNTLGAVDMSGNELLPNQPGLIKCQGTAYDDTDPDNPALWLFQRELINGSKVNLNKFDINTKTFSEIIHVVNDLPNSADSDYSGGLFITEDAVSGKKLLLGCIQTIPATVFAYELPSAPAPLYNIDLMELDILATAEINEEVQIMGTVKNLGSETVTSFDVSYAIDGGTPVISSVTGLSIPTDETYDFTSGETVSFDTDGSYEIVITIENINGNTDEEPSNNTLSHTIDVEAAAASDWEIAWSFEANGGYMPGIETDGTNIYCSRYYDTRFVRYDMDGGNATIFTMDGCSSIRDMAYDGTYFYGAKADMNLKVMDLVNETLISTIAVNCTGITGILHIAYDPNLDSGNGGFWIGNKYELGAIDMDGNELLPNQGGMLHCYGSAFDDTDPNIPVLWLFEQEGGNGEKVNFRKFDINTLTYSEIIHTAEDIPSYEPGTSSKAGGLCTWDDPVTGKKLLIGNIQQSPNLIFAYELPGAPAPIPPVPVKSTGIIIAGLLIGLVVVVRKGRLF